jgi:uncharacterized membrane protein YjjP (DUF1212 family)
MMSNIIRITALSAEPDPGPTPAAPSSRAAASSQRSEAIAFLLKLGAALHAYGTPAHRQEEVLTLLSSRLGLTGAQFFTTPTSIMSSFEGGEHGTQEARLLRLEPGDNDLGQLSQLDDVVCDVIYRRLSLREGVRRIDDTLAAPPRYGRLLRVLAFGLASAMAAALFKGAWPEMLASGVVGLLVGGLALLAGRAVALGRLFEVLAATVASFAASAAASLVWGSLSVYVVTISGLIALVPGLTLTVAMTEVANRSLVSGTARITAALTSLVQLGLGVALGARLAAVVGLSTAGGAPPTAAASWVEPLAVVVAPLAFALLFRALPRDIWWIMLIAVLAYVGGRLGALYLGPELGACCGAFAAAAGSNLWARVLNRPSSITQVPAILLLVPGSTGFRSMLSLLEQDVVGGVNTAFSMMLVAAALVGGVLLANALLPSRRLSL